MVTIENPQVKTQIIQRLARIEGQLRGVQKMITEERDCKAVVQQLIAIRSAVQSATLTFVQEAASECLINVNNANEGENSHAQQTALADMITLLGKVAE